MLLSVALLVLLLPMAVVPWLPTRFLKGLFLGGLLVGGPALLWSWVVQVTGTAPTMMGDQAEQWTASELRKLAGGWRVVNHFALGGGDIDHVAVGPAGALAVETKWSARPWDSPEGQQRQHRAATQAAANSRQLRLWYPFKSADVPVQAVVVLWGGQVRDWPPEQQIRTVDGVPTVAGPALVAWVQELAAGALGAHQVTTVWNALDEQVHRRDPRDLADYPVPLSLGEMAARTVGALVAAILGFLVVANVLDWTQSVVWSIASGLGTGILAASLIKLRIARPVAWGLLLGTGLPSIALAIGLVVDSSP